MSLYESIHRNAAPGTKASFEYLLVYLACFALYFLPVVTRRLNRRARKSAGCSTSIMSETGALAANCAASSFSGL
ncbi:hypothetical protein [Bradyrhizobium jicamae]|uniref:hypothetical protein n=1 Tax=Bradyrhizobium jicamae TaxID=280332 RepID=UPI001BA928D0|nr:hypothetical protein [Bradyrhizobium jicamae]MBR0934186.1 hypothetical protein [Bradyrhizobium jicamae]